MISQRIPYLPRKGQSRYPRAERVDVKRAVKMGRGWQVPLGVPQWRAAGSGEGGGNCSCPWAPSEHPRAGAQQEGRSLGHQGLRCLWLGKLGQQWVNFRARLDLGRSQEWPDRDSGKNGASGTSTPCIRHLACLCSDVLPHVRNPRSKGSHLPPQTLCASLIPPGSVRPSAPVCLSWVRFHLLLPSPELSDVGLHRCEGRMGPTLFNT